MDMTQDEILSSFRRQVRLCRGIGRQAMLDAIEEARRDGVFRFERVRFEPEPAKEVAKGESLRERLNLAHTILGRAISDAGSELPDYVLQLLRQARRSLDDASRWKGQP